MRFAGVVSSDFVSLLPIEVPSSVSIDWINQRLLPKQGLKMGKDKSKNRDAKKAGHWPEKRYIGIPELKGYYFGHGDIILVPDSTKRWRRLQSIAE